MTLKTLKVAQLVLDYTLYPRHEIDDEHVRSLVHALEAGVVLPPIVADRPSLRVIDGFHRRTAHERHGGPDAPVQVDLRDYYDESARFEDAVKRNAGHGRKLTSYDAGRILVMARGFGLDDDRIAKILSITRERLESIEARKIARDPEGEPVVIRNTVQSFAGEQLTVRQYEGAKRTGGMRPTFYVNQVINLLEFDLVQDDDERLIERLIHLRELLNATNLELRKAG